MLTLENSKKSDGSMKTVLNTFIVHRAIEIRTHNSTIELIFCGCVIYTGHFIRVI